MFGSVIRALRPAFVRRIHTNDTVSIKNLRYKGLINDTETLLRVSTDLITDFGQASTDDDLKYSINYAVLSRDIRGFERRNINRSFRSVLQLGDGLFKDVLFESTNCKHATLTFDMEKQNCQVRVEMQRDLESEATSAIKVTNIAVDTLIGVFKEERLAKQPVVLELVLTVTGDVSIDNVISAVKQYVSDSQFKTVEALVLNVSKLVFQVADAVDVCEVSVLKPEAIEETDGVGVSVKRSRQELADMAIVDFEGISSEFVPNLGQDTAIVEGKHTVYLAVGSNQGAQVSNIERALKELEAREINVVATSTLFRSKPMYFLDQPDFVNGCIKVETFLQPQELLDKIKEIEYEALKRVKHFDNGPRSIDLDILLYDGTIFNAPNLNIPHISMLERPFVLAPLCELVPPDMLHPVTAEPIHNHWRQLKATTPANELQPFVNLPGAKMLPFGSKTFLMGILNVTPDSFSDGSVANLAVDHALSKVEDMVSSGVDVIDLGGCSTRPGAVQVSEKEELSRVLPVLDQIRKQFPDVVLSIDTYRSGVALESARRGAHIINDVSGGLFDERIFDVAAETGMAYILGHTRGDVSTMARLTDYQDFEDGIKQYSQLTPFMSRVCKELATALDKLEKAGVRRWQVLLDPGLGFAKNSSQNIELIRDLDKLKNYKQLSQSYTSFDNIPVLMGPSRKRFIGEATGKAAGDRLFGTAAAVTACIASGSDMVRVHDYKEMKDITAMADLTELGDVASFSALVASLCVKVGSTAGRRTVLGNVTGLSASVTLDNARLTVSGKMVESSALVARDLWAAPDRITGFSQVTDLATVVALGDRSDRF
ncbi:hypothetical protein OGAPHI_005134 [Ogataea philodendri]|uniref:Pterin-binding domain-containing protein n=1 Tax=Ogataea philodendri TaxID=1378263 RepID=A0A9P8P2Q3_9ASCO|nr:uncharacterized protein OGAPHI_005134 [Ogataea philodendri]KAH3663732.1 hypothetical protein OGAPHI_005134 [Ogataea philodendri]